jgi:hypothetical protein
MAEKQRLARKRAPSPDLDSEVASDEDKRGKKKANNRGRRRGKKREREPGTASITEEVMAEIRLWKKQRCCGKYRRPLDKLRTAEEEYAARSVTDNHVQTLAKSFQDFLTVNDDIESVIFSRRAIADWQELKASRLEGIDAVDALEKSWFTSKQLDSYGLAAVIAGGHSVLAQRVLVGRSDDELWATCYGKIYLADPSDATDMRMAKLIGVMSNKKKHRILGAGLH